MADKTTGARTGRPAHMGATYRQRQPETYQIPVSPAYPCQLKAITDRLTAHLHRDRAGRLNWISATLGRRVPALLALSVTDATIILLDLGIVRGNTLDDPDQYPIDGRDLP